MGGRRRSATRQGPQYAVARDGRFLINQPVGDATAAPITLILNWQGGLSARKVMTLTPTGVLFRPWNPEAKK